MTNDQQHLVMDHLRRAYWLVRRLRRLYPDLMTRLDPQDMQQEAALCLCECALSYVPGPACFFTYFSRVAWRRLFDVCLESGTVRVPASSQRDGERRVLRRGLGTVEEHHGSTSRRPTGARRLACLEEGFVAVDHRLDMETQRERRAPADAIRKRRRKRVRLTAVPAAAAAG
jgi:hypothetical protein